MYLCMNSNDGTTKKAERQILLLKSICTTRMYFDRKHFIILSNSSGRWCRQNT